MSSSPVSPFIPLRGFIPSESLKVAADLVPFFRNSDSAITKLENGVSQEGVDEAFAFLKINLNALEGREGDAFNHLMALSERFDRLVKLVRSIARETSLYLFVQKEVQTFAEKLINALKSYSDPLAVAKQIDYLKIILDYCRLEGQPDRVILPYYAQILRLSKGTFDAESRRSFFAYYEDFIRHYKEQFERRIAIEVSLPDAAIHLENSLQYIRQLKAYGLNKELIQSLYITILRVLSRSGTLTQEAIVKRVTVEVDELNQTEQLPTLEASPLEMLWLTLQDYRTRFKEAFESLNRENIRLFQKERLEAFRKFFEEELILKNPFSILLVPCQPHVENPQGCYTLRMIGSSGREELTPYSDLEFFILFSNEGERIYGEELCELLTLTSLGFAEGSPPSLIGIHSEDLVRKGLYVDPPLEIKKVEQFIAQQGCITTRDELLYRTSVLKSSPLKESHPPLFTDYQLKLREISFQKRAEELLRYRIECFANLDYRGLQLVQLKSHFMELFNHTLNDLSLYHGIETANTLDIIDELVNKQIFNQKTGRFLKEISTRLYMLRIKVQLFYDCAKEEILLRPIHSPAEVGTYVATPEEKLLLELTHFLIFIPLYNKLRQHIQPSFSNLESLQQLDLIEELFQYLSRLNWTTERNLIESILKAFLKAPDYFNSGSHEKFYQLLSTNPAYEPARTLFIDQLAASSLHEIVNDLAIIPNRDGMRQSTRLSEKRFQEQLRSLVQSLPTAAELLCKIVSPTLSGMHYLKPALLSIFEKKKIFLLFSAGMGVRQGYQTSAHSVFRYQRQDVDLHFKQKPCHPLMEYAVYNLISRIIGVGTPVTELARFELSINGRPQPPYPVLISETIPGATIDTLLTPPNYNLRVSPAHFTWMCLVSLLTRPGDGRAANYVVTPHGLIYCVDNDISLVEPIVRYTSRRKVKFCSILFCLRELLDQNVLYQFCQLDIESILSSWIDDVTVKEKQYCTLFSPLERQRLYDEDKDSRFTPTLLFRPGELGALYAQFHHLKQFIKKVKPTTPLDLLSSLLTLRGEEQVTSLIGPRVRTAYELGLRDHPKEQLAQALGRSMRQSLTSPEAMKVSIGRTPTVQEIESKTFSIHQAREELITYTLLHKEGIEGAKKGTIEVNFAPWNHDFKQELEKLNFILSYISRLPTKPTALVLTNSSVLTEQLLTPLLHEEITLLNLSGCTKLTSVSAIVTQCPHIEKLYLSGCTTLKAFDAKRGNSSVPAELLYLRELHLARCPNLQTILLKSHALKDLKANNNPRLTTLDLDVPVLPMINVADCPRLDPTWDWRMKSVITSHTNPWGLSNKDLHLLYDNSLKDLLLFSEGDLRGAQETIQIRRSLKYLRLQLLTAPDSVMSFAEAVIQMNFPLQILDLRLNSLGDTHVETLAHSLEQNNTLLRLSLDRNRITNQGAKRLLAALQTNTTLLALDLGFPGGSNAISQEIRQEISACLERNHQLKAGSCSSSSSTMSSSSSDLERTEQQMRLLGEQIDALEKSQYSLKEEEVSRVVEELNQITPNLAPLRELQERAEALYTRCVSSSSSTFCRAQILQHPLASSSPVSLECLAPLSRYPEFGAKEWIRYFGDVGVEPPPPPNIEEILASPCSFWPERKIVETHLLVLIPAIVNGRPFTLNYLSELIQTPKNGGHATKYRNYWDILKSQEGEKSVERPYWVLMTRDVLPGTRIKSYSDQKKILEEKAKSTPLLSKGEVPTLLEAATSLLIEYVRAGRRLYTDKPWTYTRCQKVCQGIQSVAGGFSSAGLSLDFINSNGFLETHGLACCRKFLSH